MQKVSENDKLMFIQMRNLISNDGCLCSSMHFGEEKRRHLEPTSLKFAICLIESLNLQVASENKSQQTQEKEEDDYQANRST